MGKPLEAVTYSAQAGGYIAVSSVYLDRLYIIPEQLYQLHWEQRMKRLPCTIDAQKRAKLAHQYVMQNWHTDMAGITMVLVGDISLLVP